VNAPADHYFHPPGAPSRWGVVDVGLKCVHSCAHCYYVHLDGSDDPFIGMRKATFHSTDWLKRQVRALKANGFVGFDVTGGEPLIHKGLVEIIQEATDVGIASRIISLGQFLDTRDLLNRLLSAGLTDFLFSYHSSNPETFKAITGESLDKLETAMYRLDMRGFQYGTNTVVTELNFRELPDIARTVARHNVYVSNLILHNAYYQWSKDQKADGVQARYAEVYPYLLEARDILEAAGVAVNIRYAPLCSVKGMERNLVGITGVRYDPHEWLNDVQHYATDENRTPEQQAARISMTPGSTPGAHLFMHPIRVNDMDAVGYRGSPGAPSKVFPPSCAECPAIYVCDGIDANYLSRHGSGEFIPYAGPSRGSFLDRDRLNHKPVFAVKLQPWADVRSAIQEHCAK
jgi:wyosine [tRNA(Phe)-imidazoG37] synthetase (radical SAM superfamily)